MNANSQDKSKRREICYLFSYQRLFGTDAVSRTNVPTILSLGLYYAPFNDSLEEELQLIGKQEYCRQFTLEQVALMLKLRTQLTDELSTLLQKWKFDRLAKVDQVLLLLGTSEFHATPTPPLAVICNEYTNLAKKYGHEESSSFINGVLESYFKKYIRS